MSADRYASVLGLGFGDCGKGHFIHALARQWEAHTVVRFSGGAQAGHNVIVRGNGCTASRHHTFSQFGAATLLPKTRTLLLDPMILHPTALLVEAEALGRIGATDALSRLTIDGRCRITTPYHQAAGRLRERLRGAAPHGTVGVGVGETVRHSLDHPGQTVRYADFANTDTAGIKAVLEKLRAMQQTLLAELAPRCAPDGNDVREELAILEDESLATKWLTQSQLLARQCPPAPTEIIHEQLNRSGTVLFEGAQGILLDEWRGFHPHTTWSSITTAAVEKVASRFGVTAPIEHYGVLRSYLTRHGAGPFPTHDTALDAILPEPHNSGDGWQGTFRRGHPDAVLLRYAFESIGPLAGIFISHLDVFQRGTELKWCESYTANGSLIRRLPLCANEDLTHQSTLTNLLLKVLPEYAPKPIKSADAFLAHLSDITHTPITLRSHGPAFEDIHGW